MSLPSVSTWEKFSIIIAHSTAISNAQHSIVICACAFSSIAKLYFGIKFSHSIALPFAVPSSFRSALESNRLLGFSMHDIFWPRRRLFGIHSSVLITGTGKDAHVHFSIQHHALLLSGQFSVLNVASHFERTRPTLRQICVTECHDDVPSSLNMTRGLNHVLWAAHCDDQGLKKTRNQTHEMKIRSSFGGSSFEVRSALASASNEYYERSVHVTALAEF